MKADIEIARETPLKKIKEIATEIGIPREEVQNYGRYIAKIPIHLIDEERIKQHNLILVTAITPNKAGVGKTTVSIGLALGLNRLGKKAIVALREPSLGPCFGMKGGAAGGGYAQVLPMENINLHFTGDFHAVTSAHNMITALLDNYLYQNRNNCAGLKEIKWKRVLDVNDRSLRNIVTGLGGNVNGIPTETGFDITPASEIMAILCLASDIEDLKRRIGNILLGYTYENKPFTVTGDSFEDAAIQLTAITNTYDNNNNNPTEYNAPELFFGTVLAFDRDTLFTYDDVKGEEAALSGWLYRGVAGIQLSLFNVPEEVTKIELLADTIYTEVGARYYDDFLYAYEPQKEEAYKRFALGEDEVGTSWNDFEDKAKEDEAIKETLEDIEAAVDETILEEVKNKRIFHIVGPNLLTDICTSLSVRITEKKDDVTTETKFARLRLKETGTEVPVTKAAPDGGPGTGIVEDYQIPDDPENPDANDPNAPFRVCFQRNNYYQIVGDYEKLLTQKYTLRVLVNPNWDGNVELSLEKDQSSKGDSSTNP